MGKGEKNQLKISLGGSTKHKKTLQKCLKIKSNSDVLRRRKSSLLIIINSNCADLKTPD